MAQGWSKGTWSSARWGPWEPRAVQQDQVQVLHLDHGNSWCQSRLGDEQIQSSCAEKELGVQVG